MHVVAITAVKNEIDIIEAFVRHTLACAERLVVLDNGSSDGTLDVLRALEAEGLALDIVEDPSPGMYQARRMTRLMHEWAIGRHNASWVLPLDADEFVQVPDGAALIPPDARADRPITISWRTYVPCPQDDPGEVNPVVRIRHRLRTEACAWVKVVVPGALARRPDASLIQGQHDLLLGGKPCPTEKNEAAGLAHFPMRSPGQYLAKIAMNTLQYRIMPDRRFDAGWHYREAYDLLRRDPKAFSASFFAAARSYATLPGTELSGEMVAEPLDYRGGHLRHARQVDDEARGWLAVLGWADDLARRHAALVACLDEHQRVSIDRLAEVFSNVHTHFTEQYHMALRCHTYLAERNHQLDRIPEQMARQVEKTARQVEQTLKESWTWKVGRLVVAPLGQIKALGRWGKRALGA